MTYSRNAMTSNLQDINLPGLNCIEFTVLGTITSSEADHALVEEMMMTTAHEQEEDPDSLSAVYGTRYNVGANWVGGFGNLVRVSEDTQWTYYLVVTYRVDEDEIPPPPSDFKRVMDLLELTGQQFGQVSARYEATFVYPLGDGVQSRVQLPVPLLMAEQSSNYRLTHIEALILSRREDDQITHRVQVNSSEDGKSVSHTVRLEDRSVVTLERLHEMLTTASNWSLALMDFDSEGAK